MGPIEMQQRQEAAARRARLFAGRQAPPAPAVVMQPCEAPKGPVTWVPCAPPWYEFPENAEERLEKAATKIDDIKRAVCQEFAITKMDIDSKRRTLGVVRPRQIAMYLTKKMTTRSLPEIGRMFGGKDHTTVLHAVRKIEMILETDIEMVALVEKLEARVSQA